MRILIVDDDPVGCKMVATVLGKFGYDVVSAADGALALEMLSRDHYPIVVCDWQMPGVSGLDVCRWIRANPGGRSTYIIMLTSRSGFEVALEGLDGGADTFLCKPCDPRLLLDHIRAGEQILACTACDPSDVSRIAR